MSDAMFTIARELAPQRSISLYRDQEEAILELAKKLNKRLSIAEVIRVGVDNLLKNLPNNKEAVGYVEESK